MSRATLTVVVTAAILATAVSAAASGVASEGTAASKARVIISEQGRSEPLPARGTFVLEGAAGRDSGTTRISPANSPRGLRDGQSFQRVSATENLSGKHGALTLAWTGVRVDAGGGVDILYGTWRIVGGFGTGVYKSWTGGGRWAATENGNRYTIRFEGLVTAGRPSSG